MRGTGFWTLVLKIVGGEVEVTEVNELMDGKNAAIMGSGGEVNVNQIVEEKCRNADHHLLSSRGTSCVCL